ncbi:hypothetical protein C0995_009444 [Termitomyces sp. Mi166|nr:hypothetical protein C0995_009444 [Termitomyces sp. Mi166\
MSTVVHASPRTSYSWARGDNVAVVSAYSSQWEARERLQKATGAPRDAWTGEGVMMEVRRFVLVFDSNRKLPRPAQCLVVNGSSSLSLTLLSIPAGLAFVLASSTKVPLAVCPSNGTADERAEARFRLAIEHTKRTISASPGTATCSVESLKDGIDYTGSIKTSSAQVDPHHVDEIVYVEGSASLPGLDETLKSTVGFHEEIETPFARGTVVGGGVGDPTTVLARGCAVQGALLVSIPNDEQHQELRAAYERGSKSNQVQATSQTETALPARRVVRFDVELAAEGEKKLVFEVWEVAESIRVEKVAPPAIEADEEDEEEEEPEELEVKHRVVKKAFLGAIQAEALLGIQTKGRSKDAGKWFTAIEVQFVIDVSGALSVDIK